MPAAESVQIVANIFHSLYWKCASQYVLYLPYDYLSGFKWRFNRVSKSAETNIYIYIFLNIRNPKDVNSATEPLHVPELHSLFAFT